MISLHVFSYFYPCQDVLIYNADDLNSKLFALSLFVLLLREVSTLRPTFLHEFVLIFLFYTR